MFHSLLTIEIIPKHVYPILPKAWGYLPSPSPTPHTVALTGRKTFTGAGSFIPFSIQRKSDKKQLLSMWINVERQRVGILYTGTTGPASIPFFSKVPFVTSTWFQLTFRFRGFQKIRPTMELYVNDVGMGERIMNRNFRDAILQSNKDDLEITLADKWGVEALPKVCCFETCPSFTQSFLLLRFSRFDGCEKVKQLKMFR